MSDEVVMGMSVTAVRIDFGIVTLTEVALEFGASISSGVCILVVLDVSVEACVTVVLAALIVWEIVTPASYAGDLPVAVIIGVKMRSVVEFETSISFDVLSDLDLKI